MEKAQEIGERRHTNNGDVQMLQLTRVHRCFSWRMFPADDCRLQAEAECIGKIEMMMMMKCA